MNQRKYEGVTIDPVVLDSQTGTLQIIGPPVELQPTIKLGTLQIQLWNQGRQGTLQMPQTCKATLRAHIHPRLWEFTANLIYFTAKL
jgi:hypothetical protein